MVEISTLIVSLVSLLCTTAKLSIHVASAQSVRITDTTLRDGQHACPDSQVTLTCKTTGSSTIAWRSATFIGGGGNQLEFANTDRTGTTQSISTTLTVATLTENEVVNGEQVLVSTLDVLVTQNISNSRLSITCDASGSSTTEYFTALRKCV